MPTLGTVEHLDVFKDILPGLIPCTINPPTDAFALQQLEEAFSNRIVVTVMRTWLRSSLRNTLRLLMSFSVT